MNPRFIEDGARIIRTLLLNTATFSFDWDGVAFHKGPFLHNSYRHSGLR